MVAADEVGALDQYPGARELFVSLDSSMVQEFLD